MRFALLRMPMGQKTLLVLAASRYQLDAIRAARRLGLRVVTTDNVPENPGHALADRAYHVDTTDTVGVLAIARTERIAGVLAPCTDIAMPTAAVVARELGLPGPPAESVRVVCDKPLFRRFLREKGFACPEFFEASEGSAPDTLGTGTWIVKPDASSGSKGVFLVRDAAELRERLPETVCFSKRRRAIVERFIEGHQGTCEGILRDGRIVWNCLLDRRTAPPPHAATTGHFLPTRLPQEQRQEIIETIERVWQELEIRDGPFDCDFVVESDGRIFLLELSPRLGGNSISGLIQSAFDFDLVDYAVQAACGAAPPLPAKPEPVPSAVLILGVPRAGRLAFDAGQATALAGESWVRRLSFDAPAGSPVEAFIDGRCRVGEAIVQAETREALAGRVTELEQRLALRAQAASAASFLRQGDGVSQL